jgi:hypothetical protein
MLHSAKQFWECSLVGSWHDVRRTDKLHRLSLPSGVCVVLMLVRSSRARVTDRSGVGSLKANRGTPTGRRGLGPKDEHFGSDDADSRSKAMRICGFGLPFSPSPRKNGVF